MELPPEVDAVISQSIDFVYSFAPLAEATVVLVPQIVEDQVSALSDAVGFDIETLKYVLAYFLCYPLGIIMHMLPYGKLKHLFSFLLGVFLLQFTVGKQWIHQLITTVVAYAMLLILPRKYAKIALPTWAILYCCAAHLHRQYINYLGWDLDFSGNQMVITIKLYSIAYNLYDGELIAQGKENRATKKCAAYALTNLPAPLEFFGYMFCFANVLAGPAYEYSTYAAACDGSLLYDANGKPRGKIPSNIWPTIRPLLTSILCIAAFVVGNGAFPLLDPTDPQKNTPVVITEDFLQKPWPYRFAYMWMSLLFIRMKYYFGWKNAEGANNIWYAGFEGFDENGNVKGWDVSSNIDILAFETAPNLKTLSAVWNKKTAIWLSQYVYMRTNGSLLATYALSAFWHGFYPGYYLFFLSVPLLTFCERIGRKKLSPIFSTGGKWSPYGIVTMVTTSIFAEYVVVPFQLLAYDWSYACWKSHFFFGHILCALFYVVVSQLPTPKKEEATKKKAA